MQHDIVIVGGGPIGLFLACELQLAGVQPLVLERLSEPDQADKAHGVAGQVVRLLDHRGLFARCGGSGIPTPAPKFYFGAMPIPLEVLGKDNPLYLLRCDQRELERVLAERAIELGVEVRRSWEVTSFAQTADLVQVTVRDPDGNESAIVTSYLVGCDGGRSMVRKQAGFSFPGTRNDNIVDRWATVKPGGGLQIGPGGHVQIEGLGDIPAHFHRTERGIFAALAHDPEHPLVFTSEWEDHPVGNSPGPGAPMTLTEMEDSIERVLGVRVQLQASTGDVPTVLRRLCGRNTRLVDSFRNGRIFLAGDAAHVSAGPTLNQGMMDAANLAWKLAAALHGWGSEELLDSYSIERHASGERVATATQAETALKAPGSDVTALRQLFSEMLCTPSNVQKIADLIAGSDTRYHMGATYPEADTSHNIIGRFVPVFDVIIGDGRTMRVAELLRTAQPVLLDLTDGNKLAEIAAPWRDRVLHVAAKSDNAPAQALLIRPDGYVAWTGANEEGLQAALTRWFGVGRR